MGNVKSFIGRTIVIPRASTKAFAPHDHPAAADGACVEERVTLAGLDAPATVERDDFGVPHIWASTQHDMFFL